MSQRNQKMFADRENAGNPHIRHSLQLGILGDARNSQILQWAEVAAIRPEKLIVRAIVGDTEFIQSGSIEQMDIVRRYVLVPDVLGFGEVGIQLNLRNMLIADSIADENLVLRRNW